MKKRTLLMIVAFMLLSGHAFAEPKSFAEAWRYVSTEGKSERWVVVRSPKTHDYFECENLDDVVRCVVPIWIQVLPSRSERVLPANGRKEPYPAIPGSKRDVYIDDNTVEKSKRLFAKYGLEPYFVYSQVKDESHKIIGTQCDLRVVLSFDFKDFEVLAKEYLRELFGVTENDGYEFDADS